MIVDHVGYFLFPQYLELRMIGRVAFPLFFLLIWWNGSSRIWLSLIIWAILIQGTLRALSYVKWYPLRQLNILPAAIIVKLLLGVGIVMRKWLIDAIGTITRDAIDAPTLGLGTVALDTINEKVPSVKVVHDTVTKWVFNIAGFIILTVLIATCSLLVDATKTRIEYGTMVLGTALLGVLLKHYKRRWIVLWVPILLSLWGLREINANFQFSPEQRSFIVVCWIIWILFVRSMSYRNRSMRLFRLWDQFILFLSKYAVWIYVIHFLVLLGVMFVLRL